MKYFVVNYFEKICSAHSVIGPLKTFSNFIAKIFTRLSSFLVDYKSVVKAFVYLFT